MHPGIHTWHDNGQDHILKYEVAQYHIKCLGTDLLPLDFQKLSLSN